MGTYQLGVDLGTTYTGSAVRRDGTSAIVTLGTRSATMPTVVVAGADGSMVVGEAAERRALELPERTARQFKRRLGDTTPILLGGTPYSPQALLAAVLADVVGRVTAEQGEAPERVALTHPANWGPYKRELVRQVAELAGLGAAGVVTLTEPAAAALHYASQAHLEPGSTVAVYDLGGGTFDAAVVRIDVSGAELLGEPTGIEHLGGIDFDAAVFEHVGRQLGNRLDPLLGGSAEDAALLWRLREECTRAKEALSTDADAVVGVALPDGFVEVRITRSEFEELVRPALAPTAAALRRAVESAGIAAEDLAGVLLVGGSSRIPLVSEIVANELGRPVLLDTHPKHAVALGAAAHAAGVEVGEAVAVVGGEPAAALETEPLARSWRAPAVAALVVLLAAVGLLVGLVASGDDDPDELAVENVDDERPTTTGDEDDGAVTTTETTSTTVVLAPGETVPEGAVTSILPTGETVVVQRPTGGGGGGGGGAVTTTQPSTQTTAATPVATTAPPTFSTPSAPRSARATFIQITDFFPDNISKTVRVALEWSAPTNLGGGLSHYRIVGTPLFEGTTPFGTVIDFNVPASQLSAERDVTITQSSGQGLSTGGYVRWEIYAVNGAGTASAPTRPSFVVPNLVDMSRYHHFRVIWSIGGSVGTFTNGTCDPALVCGQSPAPNTSLASSQRVDATVNG